MALEIIEVTQKGAGNLPVSVKTRLGWNENEVESWIPHLLKAEPADLILHGRTRKQMSKVPADWNAISRAVEIRNSLKSKTLIIGNGDVKNPTQARLYASQYGVDGIMIGRGIFGNPWLFNESIDPMSITPQQKLEVMLEHTKLFGEIFQNRRNFAIMKKHYKAYVNGWKGAKSLRIRLMQTQNFHEVEEIVQSALRAFVEHHL